MTSASHRLNRAQVKFFRSYLPLLTLLCLVACKEAETPWTHKTQLTSPGAAATEFADARRGFETKLTRNLKESIPPAEPPARMFQLVSYESPAGKLSAYLGRDPGDGKKHPAIVWLVGGFSSSISAVAWEAMPRENDQSAAIFRKAGLVMMYPSLRGGNVNPGNKEGFLGEVDDVIAAAEHLKSLDYVDPKRIYLGGHSTGGTLALLTAAASGDLFRAVLALGPSDDPAGYPREHLPYDINDPKERRLRAPVHWLDSIRVPTFVSEGNDGNLASLQVLQQANRNPKVFIFPIAGMGHFDVIVPLSESFAEKILADDGASADFSFGRADIKRWMSARRPPPRCSFPAGDPRADRITFEYAAYLLQPTKEAGALAQVRKLIADEFPDLHLVGADDLPADRLEILPAFIANVPGDYAPPGMESLRYFGKGLSREQADQLQKSKNAIKLWFRHPRSLVHEGLKTANRVMHRVAETMNGIAWDEQTRQVFSPAYWQQRRIAEWSGEYPEAEAHLAIHAYRNGENIRAITLGMEKFGLPDVVVEQFSWSDNRSMGNLLNSFCQSLVEGAVLAQPDDHLLDLRALKHAGLREGMLKSLIGDGSGKVRLALKRAAWDEGDPHNRIVELAADHYPGPDMFAMQNAMLDAFLGSKDEVQLVKHSDADLQAASRRARSKLLAIRKDFDAGLEPGEFILIKAPFDVPTGGREWMWVEVNKWETNAIIGMLRSEPRSIPNLKAGQVVSVKADTVFDYIRRFPDGTSEGNETGKIIEAMRNRKRSR